MAKLREDGYTEIGRRCEPFDSKIDIHDANTLRDYVLYEHIMTAPGFSLRHNEDEGRVSHAKLFPNNFMEDVEDVPSVFGAAMLKNISPDVWRIVIMQTRTRRRSENIGQQRIVARWNVEVMGDVVVEATRKVQIYRELGEPTVEAITQSWAEIEGSNVPVRVFERSGEQAAGYQPERKQFERHMVPEDCERAIEFLGRVSSRLAAVG